MINVTHFLSCNVVGGKVKFLEEVEQHENEKTADGDKIVMEPYVYHKENFKYTNFQVKIAKAFNYWIQAPQDKFDLIHNAVEVSLIAEMLLVLRLADILSDRDVKQGKATAHVVYGKPQVLNTCFYCTLTLNCNNIDIIKSSEVISNECVKTCRLAAVLPLLVDEGICPDEKLYYQTVGYKNSFNLLLTEIYLLQEMYGIKPLPPYENFIGKIKVFYTIVDECRRIAEGNPEDIILGYFALPITHAIGSSILNGQVLRNIMRQRTKTEELLSLALSIVKKSGSLDYCKKELYKIKQEILMEYKKFDKNPLLDEFFDEYLVVPEDFADVNWIIS